MSRKVVSPSNLNSQLKPHRNKHTQEKKQVHRLQQHPPWIFSSLLKKESVVINARKNIYDNLSNPPKHNEQSHFLQLWGHQDSFPHFISFRYGKKKSTRNLIDETHTKLTCLPGPLWSQISKIVTSGETNFATWTHGTLGQFQYEKVDQNSHCTELRNKHCLLRCP